MKHAAELVLLLSGANETHFHYLVRSHDFVEIRLTSVCGRLTHELTAGV